jgi:RNA polymerase sigma-70 factor (ECF subfamily)
MATRPADLQPAPDVSGDWLDDEQLLTSLRAGSAVAFSQLYRSQAVPIYNLCLRLLGSPEDAQDVTQEVFIKACRQLLGCDDSFRVKPWLYRVAVNACYDQLRARKLRGGTEPLPDDVVASPIDAFEQAELSQALEQTLAGLSVRHRTVLLLKDVNGLSHVEIGEILGVSHGATETLLFRAHEAFRRGYAALVRTEPRQACELARQAMVDAVGGGISDRERRRITAHAKDCPDCRKTVATWSLGGFCLGAFLRVAPLPTALVTPPHAAAFGTSASGSARVVASAGKANSTWVSAAKAAAVAAPTGASTTTAASLTVGALAKMSIIAVIAGVMAVSGGAAVKHLVASSRHPTTHVPQVSLVKVAGAPDQGVQTSAALLGAIPGLAGQTHGRGAALGQKPADHKHGKSPAAAVKSKGKDHAPGQSGKPAKTAKPKPAKTAKPKPAKTAKPKPAKTAKPKPAKTAKPKPSGGSGSKTKSKVY